MLQETAKIWMDGAFVDWKNPKYRSWLTPVR